MIVTKTVAAVEPVEDVAEFPHGGFELILSDPSEDRDGETVEPRAFDPLPDHIAMDIDHGMSVATTVGSGVPSYNDAGQLIVRGGFASTALGQETRTLVTEGHIRTASVAMIVQTKTKAASGSGKRITKAVLLNGAFTPVPANPAARILSSKALEGAEVLAKEGKRNSATDQEQIQTAHDALVAAGASCSDTKSLHVKSIIGSVEALQDRVNDALQDAYGSGYSYWGWLRGVLPNPAHDGGTVIFQSSQLGDPDVFESVTYSQPFTDDGSVVTLTGDATEVDIHEVVAPDADADRESKSVPADRSTAAATGSDSVMPDLTGSAAGATDDDTARQVQRGRAMAISGNAAAL